MALVAAGDGVVAGNRAQQRQHLGLRQGLGQARGHLGPGDVAGGVGGGPPLVLQEPVERPHRHERPGHRRRRPARGPEEGEVVLDHGLGDRGRREAPADQELVVRRQVAPVGGESVHRAAAFDAQPRQELLHLQREGLGHPARAVRGSTAGRPRASATAGLVTWPPAVLTPARSAGSRLAAASGTVAGDGGDVRQGGVGQRVGRGVGHGRRACCPRRSAGRRAARRPGSAWVVSRMVSTQPPWSMAMSTITAPGFMPRTMSSVTTTGARPPATSTAPMTRSASATARSTAPRLDASVMIRPLWIWSTKRSRSRLRSSRQDLGLHARGDPRRVPPDVAGAEHDDAGRAHAGRAAQQHAPAAVVALEEVGADLGGHAAGDLAHGRQQRQPAPVDLDRLVRQRRWSCGRAGRRRRRGRPPGAGR